MLHHEQRGHFQYATIIASVLISATLSSLLTVAIVSRNNTVSLSRDVTIQEDQLVEQVVKKNGPAVVSIAALKDLSDASRMTGPDIEFFFPELRGLPRQQGKQRVGGGSGFIVRADGLIVTNAHVVADTRAEFLVMLSDGTEHPAKVIGRDPLLDIAVIKIEKTDLPLVKFGNSDSLFVGQTVLAIGNSLATFQNSVTKGIVSGLGRQVSVSDDLGRNEEVIDTAIQTDAAINPGNSGGPLLNLAGEVIGVNTAVSRRGQLIGFALPINSVQRIIENAVANGRIIHPWLGVRYRMLDGELRAKYKITQQNAAQVVANGPQQPAVVPKSPAALAGIIADDIIISVNNQSLDALHSLALEIAKYSVGDTIQLSIVRDGQQKNLNVTLQEFPQ